MDPAVWGKWREMAASIDWNGSVDILVNEVYCDRYKITCTPIDPLHILKVLLPLKDTHRNPSGWAWIVPHMPTRIFILIVDVLSIRMDEYMSAHIHFNSCPLVQCFIVIIHRSKQKVFQAFSG